MDRDALVRASRRRQALDALEFERDRAALLETQLEDVLAEADGARLDADLFARMDPGEASLVRTAFGEDVGRYTDEEAASDEDVASDLDDEAGVDDLEEEIARLHGELESSRRVQAALGRYVDLLSEPPGE